MTNEPKVFQLQLFAALKERFGPVAQVSIDAASAPALTAEGLLHAFLIQYQLDPATQASLRLALDHEYAAPNAPIHGHEEIAIIPPVSGG